MDDVVIREARSDDAAGMIAYMRALADEPNNNILYGPGEFTMTLDEERAFLENTAASDNSFIAVADAGGRIVGIANVVGGRRRAARHSGGIGISLHPDYRDQGLGTRMMRYLIEWARGSGVITRLELEVFTHNLRAIHVYENVGFILEGVRRKAFFKEGMYMDSMVMAMLLDEI